MNVVLKSGINSFPIMAEASGRVMLGRNEIRIANLSRNAGTLSGLLEGVRWDVEVVRIGDRVIAWSGGRTWHAEIQLGPVSGADETGEHSDRITAPMPCSVIGVHVLPSQVVAAGDIVVTIESMKMETALVAMRDGVVASVLVEPGMTVERGAVLVAFAQREDAAV